MECKDIDQNDCKKTCAIEEYDWCYENLNEDEKQKIRSLCRDPNNKVNGKTVFAILPEFTQTDEKYQFSCSAVENEESRREREPRTLEISSEPSSSQRITPNGQRLLTQRRRKISNDRFKNFDSLERVKVSFSESENQNQCISRGQEKLQDVPFCLDELSSQERKFITDNCSKFGLRTTDKILLKISTFTGDNERYAWPCNV